MKRIVVMILSLFFLLASSGCVKADWSVQWDSDSDWKTGATYENARVLNGSLDIGIYPPDSNFSGSGWTFSKTTVEEVDELTAGYASGQAYFYARDHAGLGGETGQAYAYATNTFYLDSAGIGGATLEFYWKGYSDDFDQGDGYTTLEIELQKPSGSWISIDQYGNLWTKRFDTPSTGTEGTQTVNIPAGELSESGNYKMRIYVYWYLTPNSSYTDEKFSWYVDDISFGLTRATHTNSWKDMGATSAWKTLDASASIGSGQTITTTVEVSDDMLTVKGSSIFSLLNGTNSYDGYGYISSLPNARYVRITTNFSTNSEASTPRLDNYKVTADPVPTLTSGDVTPDNGPSNTTFTYTVTYTDPDGDAPAEEYPQVCIDGSFYEMTKISGSYTSGATYQFLTATLSKGSHYYIFYAFDGTSLVRLPTSGTYSGPVVGVAPTLTTGSVSPTSGAVGATFTYEVTYTDADGDAPSYVKAYIDGTGYTMTKISGTYTGGALYRYTTSALSTGSHNYYFEASDGTYTARLPTSGSNPYPSVGVTSTTLSVSPSSFSVSSGGTQTLTATLTAGGSPLADKTITWDKTAGSVYPYSGMTSSSGQVSVTYTAPSVTVSTGVTVTASFAGDSQYGSSSDSSSGTVSPTTTPSTFSVTLTFTKPDGSALTSTAIYYGTSQGAETSYLGSTDSYGRITSTDGNLASKTVYFKSSDGSYSGSTYVGLSGGTASASLTAVGGAGAEGAGFPWAIVAAVLIIIVGSVAGMLVIARKKGLFKPRPPKRKLEKKVKPVSKPKLPKHAPSKQAGRFCPHCKLKLPADAEFCPECGRKVKG